MNGGLIEGIKKIYKCPNSLQVNLWILVLILVVTGISVYAAATMPGGIEFAQNNDTSAIYTHLFLKNPILGLILLVISVGFGGYILSFTGNAIRYFTEDSEDGNLLPDFTFKTAYKPVPGIIALAFVWGIYVTVIIGVIVFAAKLLHSIPFALVLGILVCILAHSTLPMIAVRYAEKFEIKPLLNPVIALNIIKKTFLPVWWVYLKLIGFTILVSIVIAIAALVLAGIIGIIGAGLSGMILFTVVYAVSGYIGIIVSMALYYCLAHVYTKRLKQE